MRKGYLLILAVLVLGGCSKLDFFTAIPRWTTYQSESLGTSIESPFPAEIVDQAGEYSGTLTKIASPNFFVLNFVFRRLEDKKAVINSNKVYQAGLKSMQKENILKLHLKPETVSCSGMPATVTRGTYEDQDARVHHYSHLLVVKGNRYWSIRIIHDNPRRFGEMAKRVLDSVKIAPTGSKTK